MADSGSGQRLRAACDGHVAVDGVNGKRGEEREKEEEDNKREKERERE